MNWKFEQILPVVLSMGTYLGSMISISLPDKLLKKMFGGFLLLVALKIIFSK